MNQLEPEARAPGGDAAGAHHGPLWSLRGLAFLWPGAAPLDLRILGRTLLHAAFVGGMAGVLGAAFFAALEVAQRAMLESTTGFAPLRALGETFLASEPGTTFRPWLLALMPALGGLVSGILTTRFAPEAAGGGGDAVIESYHRGGVVRRRVLPVKALAAIATLASGGSGGREGPTMQIGGAIGALVGRWLPTSARERRILLVAGIAAGMAAVFRTPLGAALLATEMLYRDDFESDALVPAIIASVVAYSIVISIFGQTTLFGYPPRFAFVPVQLGLYVLLAIFIALGAVLFLRFLRAAQHLSARSGLPVWVRPAVGGLAMGVVGTAIALVMMHEFGPAGARLSVFGGGYGVAQVAITGSGLPPGWRMVTLLAVLFFAKAVASALTIGSGGAAGDFAPSLVMGGLLGSAFGHAAALILHDPRIDPAAFALVGMGTFYGGVAHAPLGALVLVSELAGSYDLLVPMMLAIAVALVVLHNWSLYPAQPATKADSPSVRSEAMVLGPAATLERLRVGDVAIPPELEPIHADAPAAEILTAASSTTAQKVIVVHDVAGVPVGIVPIGTAQLVSIGELSWAVAHDMMVPFAWLAPDDTLADVSVRLRDTGLVQLPVYDRGAVVGYVGETELARAYAASRPFAEAGPQTTQP